MRTVTAILLILTSFLAVHAVPVQTQPAPNLGAILVCNEIVLRIRFPADEQSILQRRQIVNERIIIAYRREQVVPANITARQVGGEWTVYVGQTLIITVDREHARANATTPRALAEVWAARFRDLMPRCRP